MTKTEEWRAKARAAAVGEAVDLELPSGMVVKARRPGPAFLAGYGHLPLSLATAAMDGAAVPIEDRSEKKNDALAFAEFMRALLLYCVVSPEISLMSGPGKIHPGEIPDDDAAYIFHWAMRGSEAASLESFRRRRHDAATGGDGGKVPPAAVRADGDRGPAAGAQLRPRRGRRSQADR